MSQEQKRVVWIEWIDSVMTHGWVDPDHEKPDLMIDTILIDEDDERVMVTTSVMRENGLVTSPLSIPKVAIVKMQDVVWKS